MSAMSQAEANKWIANLQGRTLKVGLFLDASTEVSGTGYLRQTVSLSNGVYINAVGVRTANVGDVSFGTAGSDWAVSPAKISWVKVYDNADSAVVWAGELPEAAKISLISGQPYEIKADSLGLTIGTYD